jgi:hypothetical protein
MPFAKEVVLRANIDRFLACRRLTSKLTSRSFDSCQLKKFFIFQAHLIMQEYMGKDLANLPTDSQVQLMMIVFA